MQASDPDSLRLIQPSVDRGPTTVPGTISSPSLSTVLCIVVSLS